MSNVFRAITPYASTTDPAWQGRILALLAGIAGFVLTRVPLVVTLPGTAGWLAWRDSTLLLVNGIFIAAIALAYLFVRRQHLTQATLLLIGVLIAEAALYLFGGSPESLRGWGAMGAAIALGFFLLESQARILVLLFAAVLTTGSLFHHPQPTIAPVPVSNVLTLFIWISASAISTHVSLQSKGTIERDMLTMQNLEHALHDSLNETTKLYEANRSISRATTMDALLKVMIQHMTTLHPARAYIFLSEPSETETQRAITLAASYPDGRTPDADICAFDILFGDTPTMTERDNASPALVDCMTTLEISTIHSFPLSAYEHADGWIVIGFAPGQKLTPEQKRFIITLTEQTGIAIKNQRLLNETARALEHNTLLYQRTQRRARQLATSTEISRIMTSILNLEELLPQIVNQIRENFEYDYVQIFLLNDDHTHADLVAATSAEGQALLDTCHNVSLSASSTIAQVMHDGQPFIVTDVHQTPTSDQTQSLLPETQSEMVLPLKARGHTLGALDVQNRQAGSFTDDDSSVLRVLADMVATAIDNAMLFKSAEKHAGDMAFLFQVTNAAAASVDLEEALAQVVETLRTTMRATHASVYLLDSDSQMLVKGACAGTATEANDTIAVDHGGMMGWVAQHREPLVIGELADDSRDLHHHTAAHSAIALPLIAGNELTGVLTVESDTPHNFDDNDLRLLQMLNTSLAAIIDKSQLLREMQIINEQLLEVDRLKTNFLAAMSHELRTPLNSIIGFSRVILNGIDGPLTDLQEQDVGTIYNSGKHLLGLVNDLLDQAKLTAGKMTLVYDHFDLQGVIEDVITVSTGLIQDKPIELRTTFEGDLPDAYGDEFRTRQILLNLVSNATKFTESGSITIAAAPTTVNERRYIEVSVTDTGIGIATEDMSRLFEAFQQVDNSLTRKVGGTGMGLPLARSLTELQHGWLWVESEVGEGSVFSFTLPTERLPEHEPSDVRPEADAMQAAQTDDAAAATDTDATAANINADVSPPPPDDIPLPTKIALVIEDNKHAIEPYKQLLAPVGYDVVGVTDPTSIKFTLAVRPTIILLDVNMHNGAGWKVLKELETHANAPVIICSANEDREQGLAMGAQAYVDKPFQESEILDTIRHVESTLLT